MTISSSDSPFHRSNYLLSLISIVTLIVSFSLFLTFVLLVTTNTQFIAFNEFAATGKYPAVYYYTSLILICLYFGLFVCGIFGVWGSRDILHKFSSHTRMLIKLFVAGLVLAGTVQVVAGFETIYYMRLLRDPLRDYMADNLRSNYTGGFGAGYLERQFDRSVDWVQINYQCCGVKSYEDYRNGFYYNSFNKYTIVSIVPNSCCIYSESSAPNQPTKCQMKSVNIYRKGCYDILVWWMESFGLVIGSITLVFGVICFLLALAIYVIYSQICGYKAEVAKKSARQRLRQFNDLAVREFDTSTVLNETMCSSSNYYQDPRT
jgi:hypothetical protein